MRSSFNVHNQSFADVFKLKDYEKLFHSIDSPFVPYFN